MELQQPKSADLPTLYKIHFTFFRICIIVRIVTKWPHGILVRPLKNNSFFQGGNHHGKDHRQGSSEHALAG